MLARLYREMHSSAKEEFAAAEAVFPKPGMVLDMFLSRLFEQNVQAVLERLLLPSSIGMATLAAVAAQQQLPPQTAAAAAAAGQGSGGSGASGSRGPTPGHSRTNSFLDRASNLATSFGGASGAAAAAAAAAVAATAAVAGGGAGAGGDPSPSSSSSAAAAGAAGAAGGSAGLQQSAGLQRQQLRLLVECYGKTQRLASNLEKSVKGVADLNVLSMAEGLWPTFLGNYPEQELQWLQAACAEEVGTRVCLWVC